jgi:microcystin-dependent protein
VSYVGEIRLFAGNFAPVGWELCQGQHLPIAENEVLFQLIGTTYGGDGQEDFALPDLRGRLPVHLGQGPGITQPYPLGEPYGVERLTLTPQQLPTHSHAFQASTAPGASPDPQGNVIASAPSVTMFLRDAPSTALPQQTVQAVGESQAHENRMPVLPINYIIALYGIYPSPS